MATFGEAMLKIGWKRCPFCCREDIYISHPKRLWEEVSIAVLLQPVRCHDCMRRFLRPLFASPTPRIAARQTALEEPLRKEAGTEDKKRAA